MSAVDTKRREYPEEVKEAAIKSLYSGSTGRGAGRQFGMNKSNVYHGIKKTEPIAEKVDKIFVPRSSHPLLWQKIND